MYKEAETVMKEAITLMPDKARFYFSLGVLLGKTERLEVRIIVIDTISTVIIESACHCCFCYVLKEGEMYLSLAVEMRPDIAKYHVNLGS